MRHSLEKLAARLLRRTPVYVWYWASRIRRWTEQDERARALYARFLREGDLCFDIGANLGQRTRIFRQMGVRTVTVEPQALCLRVLRALYRRDPGVQLVPLAVGAGDGEADMLVNDSANSLTSLSADYVQALRTGGRETNLNWNRRTRVQVTSLDALIRQYGRPAFIKIDVEGYELEVLKGLSSRVPALSFEFTPELLPMAQDCVRRLAGLGMTSFNLSLGESMALLRDPWVDAVEMERILASRPNDPAFLGDIYARA